MSDLISRQAAIKGKMNLLVRCDDDKLRFKDVVPVEYLQNMPPAEPVQKGSWCVTPDGRLVCSCCYKNPINRIIVDGNLIYDMTPIKKLMKFCPNCGAYMLKGEKDE